MVVGIVFVFIFSQLLLLDMVRHKEVGGSTVKFVRVILFV